MFGPGVWGKEGFRVRGLVGFVLGTLVGVEAFHRSCHKRGNHTIYYTSTVRHFDSSSLTTTWQHGGTDSGV